MSELEKLQVENYELGLALENDRNYINKLRRAAKAVVNRPDELWRLRYLEAVLKGTR